MTYPWHVAKSIGPTLQRLEAGGRLVSEIAEGTLRYRTPEWTGPEGRTTSTEMVLAPTARPQEPELPYRGGVERRGEQLLQDRGSAPPCTEDVDDVRHGYAAPWRNQPR